MTEKDALGIVLDLASQNLLLEDDCDGDENLLACLEEQQEAIELVFERYKGMKSHYLYKITHGYVVQTYDTEKKDFVEQEFIPAQQISREYENDFKQVVSSKDFVDEFGQEAYLPFDMEQP